MKKQIKKAFCLICIMVLSLGFYLFASGNPKSVKAEQPIETSTGVTMSTGDSADFTEAANWQAKTLVFEIKTDGSETQFQLRKHGAGGSGIIRTKPDRGVDTADAVAYQTQSGSPYWSDVKNSYSTDLGDGWYRWVIDLTGLMVNDVSTESIDYIRCLKGTNVQVRNLKFYEVYADASNYGCLETPFNNWASEKITFELYMPDDVQRRFQLCKESGSGVSGIIRLTSFTTDTNGGIRARTNISQDGDGYKFNNPSSDDFSSGSLNRLAYANKLLMDEYINYSTDLSKVIEKYLLDNGVKSEHIESFKSIMLD